MNKFNYLVGSLIIIFLFSSCDLFDDSPCGSKKSVDLYLLGSSQLNKKFLNTYLNGNNRVFEWSELIENVCTDEHVKTEFRLAMLDENSANMFNLKARGKVSYQFLYEKEIDLISSKNDLVGNLETGLKGAFPDLSGWFIHSIYVSFPTKGSLEADEKFLFPKDLEGVLNGPIISVEITSKYREYNK
jgi:hypothetical protein